MVRTPLVLALTALLAPEAQAQWSDASAIGGLKIVVSPGTPWGVGASLEGGFAIGSGPPGALAESFVDIGLATQLGLTAAIGLRGGMGFGDPCGGGGFSTNFHPLFEVGPEAAFELSTARPPAFRPGLSLSLLNLGLDLRSRTSTEGFGRTSTGLGLHWHPPGGCAIVGRPLRDAAGTEQLPAAVLLGQTHPEALRWLERGRGEQASIPAFLRLAAELAALGAPAALVGRARAAAVEERRHAWLSYGRAAQLSGGPVLAGDSPRWTPRRLPRTDALARLAVESLREGVVDEARGAEDARRAATAAPSPIDRAIEGSIAIEEAGHAELAAAVIHWATHEGGSPVRRALSQQEAML